MRAHLESPLSRGPAFPEHVDTASYGHFSPEAHVPLPKFVEGVMRRVHNQDTIGGESINLVAILPLGRLLLQNGMPRCLQNFEECTTDSHSTEESGSYS